MAADAVDGKIKDFKIPSSFTVEEIERIYELEEKLQAEKKDVVNRWNFIFQQIAISFAKYHPELSVEELKKLFTREQALEIVGFIAKHTIAMSTKNSSGENAEEETSQKKSQAKA
jgi:hypothetical protein